jgi:hypothetical protein
MDMSKVFTRTVMDIGVFVETIFTNFLQSWYKFA